MQRSFVLPAVLCALCSLSLRAQSSNACAAETASPSTAMREILGGRPPAALGQDELLTALGDPRPEVRLLAAQMLSQSGDKSAVGPLTDAWNNETGPCAKAALEQRISFLVGRLSLDPSEHTDGRKWIAPFQSCSASGSQPVKLTVEPEAGPSPVVRLVARNLTPATVFLAQAPPQELYSVSVFDPSGAPARIAAGREAMYRPAPTSKVPVASPATIALAPQQEVTVWTWRVGEDFDMSAHGTYTVQLGGRIDYLDTTVCSNIAAFSVN